MKYLFRKSTLFTLLLLSIIIALLVLTLGYPAKAQLMPFLVGVPTAILLILALIGEKYPKVIKVFDINETGLEESAPAETEKQADKHSQATGTSNTGKRFLGFIGWMAGVFALMLLVGFTIAIPVYVFLFLMFNGRLRWQKSLMFAIVIGAVNHLGFTVLLKAHLFKGILFGDILPPLF